MKILKGYVLGVVDKGEGDKRWAIVGIKATDKDRDGFDVGHYVQASCLR
ncbi:hypothetical protein [Pseudomonas aeruginosa]|nr:hypothetical protein [Pseudomonas aeruginosa]